MSRIDQSSLLQSQYHGTASLLDTLKQLEAFPPSNLKLAFPGLSAQDASKSIFLWHISSAA